MDEASVYFQIPKGTIACWTYSVGKVLESGKQSRQASPTIFRCMWPEMDVQLFEVFLAPRELGRLVRDSWFRRAANSFWEESYPEREIEFFVFWRGWFHGFFVLILNGASVHYKYSAITPERLQRTMSYPINVQLTQPNSSHSFVTSVF